MYSPVGAPFSIHSSTFLFWSRNRRSSAICIISSLELPSRRSKSSFFLSASRSKFTNGASGNSSAILSIRSIALFPLRGLQKPPCFPLSQSVFWQASEQYARRQPEHWKNSAISPHFLALIVLACLKLGAICLLELAFQCFETSTRSLLVNETNHGEFCFCMLTTFFNCGNKIHVMRIRSNESNQATVTSSQMLYVHPRLTRSGTYAIAFLYCLPSSIIP